MDEIKACMDKISEYIAKWIQHFGKFTLDHTENENLFKEIVSNPVSTGCILYLVYAVRMGRTMVNVQRLYDNAETGPVAVSGIYRWLGWTAPDKTRREPNRLMQLGVSDSKSLKIMKDSVNEEDIQDPSDRSVAVDNHMVLMERLLLRLYAVACKNTTASNVFASEIRELIDRADAHSLHRRIFRWYKTRIGSDMSDEALQPCPPTKDYGYVGMCVGRSVPIDKRVTPEKLTALQTSAISEINTSFIPDDYTLWISEGVMNSENHMRRDVLFFAIQFHAKKMARHRCVH